MQTQVNTGEIHEAEVKGLAGLSLLVELDTEETATVAWSKLLGGEEALRSNPRRVAIGSTIHVRIEEIQPGSRRRSIRASEVSEDEALAARKAACAKSPVASRFLRRA